MLLADNVETPAAGFVYQNVTPAEWESLTQNCWRIPQEGNFYICVDTEIPEWVERQVLNNASLP